MPLDAAQWRAVCGEGASQGEGGEGCPTTKNRYSDVRNEISGCRREARMGEGGGWDGFPGRLLRGNPFCIAVVVKNARTVAWAGAAQLHVV
jgi:hypothetical protein